MKKPYVICHMLPSLDGRIVTRRWQLAKSAYAAYDRTARSLQGDAWIIGRVSMAPYAGLARVPQRKLAAPIVVDHFDVEAVARDRAVGIRHRHREAVEQRIVPRSRCAPACCRRGCSCTKRWPRRCRPRHP